jgi:hypothetical protein
MHAGEAVEQAWTVKRRRDAERVQCPLCHDALADDAALTECADCSATHHIECWTDLDRCATCTGRRSRAPGAIVAPLPAAEAPKVCCKAGCRRLAEGPETHLAELCHPHGAQVTGFCFVVVAGLAAVLIGFIAFVEGLRGKQFFRGSWDAWILFGIPITFAVWGVLTIAWGVVAERTEPNEPAPKPRPRGTG